MRADMSVTSMLDRGLRIRRVDKLIGLPAGTAKRVDQLYERGRSPSSASRRGTVGYDRASSSRLTCDTATAEECQ